MAGHPQGHAPRPGMDQGESPVRRLALRANLFLDSNTTKEEYRMNTTEARTTASIEGTTGRVDLKLEVVVIPVTDVDRAKTFYGNLGWRLDADFAFDNGFRVVQFTPPGSPTSIQFGTNITTAAPGPAQGIYLVVADVQVARDAAQRPRCRVSDVFHPGAPGAQFQTDASVGRSTGRRTTGPATGPSPRSRPRRQQLPDAGSHHPAARPHGHR